MTSPVDTVRRFYDALGRGDVPGVLATLDESLNGRKPSASHITAALGTVRRPSSQSSRARTVPSASRGVDTACRFSRSGRASVILDAIFEVAE